MTTPLIRQLTLKNFLSFGPDGVTVDLLPLNVLIGPNASGKSNLLEALAILRAAAMGDLQSAIREGGGPGEFLWKGAGHSTKAFIEVTTVDRGSSPMEEVRHGLRLGQVSAITALADEYIKQQWVGEPESETDLYTLNNLNPMLLARMYGSGGRTPVPVEGLRVDQSVLSQRRDPGRYPELARLTDLYSGISLFQDSNLGRRTPARLPQPTDLPTDFLLADGSNLGLILHDLSQTSAKRDELIHYLRRFYEHARFVSTKIQGGSLQFYVEEEGGRLIPASRLSDGTLRYLCLLAILLHPNPPPVVAIEEPELGLHPDILPTVAELLRNASERTQLFVTTHSDALVSALSDNPENILVCENMPGGTTIERLDADRLSTWLKEYSLGEIWRMGEIGGNRW